MAAAKRYQVFVSSTFQDLQEERTQVMQALLYLDCIPSGMELFPAANEDQWTLIKKVIDDCDYYVVVVAGRYGSMAEDGVSYTEKEYRYALDSNKPILGFVHGKPENIPSKFTESDPMARKKLEEFRNLVRRKLVRSYDSPEKLGTEVMQSLVRLMKTQPAIGWIRGDRALDEASSVEILRLRKKIDELENRLSESRMEAPPGTEALAQGEDVVAIGFSYQASAAGSMAVQVQTWTGEFHWNEVFSVLAPLMIHEATDGDLRARLVEMAEPRIHRAASNAKLRILARSVAVRSESFDTVRIQLRALGLIAKSQKPRSVKDTRTYWTLTPYGDAMLTRLRAILRVKYASMDPATFVQDDDASAAVE
jgi:hypothetical protein